MTRTRSRRRTRRQLIQGGPRWIRRTARGSRSSMACSTVTSRPSRPGHARPLPRVCRIYCTRTAVRPSWPRRRGTTKTNTRTFQTRSQREAKLVAAGHSCPAGTGAIRWVGRRSAAQVGRRKGHMEQVATHLVGRRKGHMVPVGPLREKGLKALTQSRHLEPDESKKPTISILKNHTRWQR